MKKVITIIILVVFVTKSYSQVGNVKSKTKSKSLTSKTTIRTSKSIPLLKVTNKDMSSKVNNKLKNSTSTRLPINSITTVLPTKLPNLSSKLNQVISPRRPYTSKMSLSFFGFFNPSVSNEVQIQPKSGQYVYIDFYAKNRAKYLVNIELNIKKESLQRLSCQDPKLSVRMDNVLQQFSLKSGVNNLEFLLESSYSGKIAIPIKNTSCKNSKSMPNFQFYKATIKEL